MSFGTVEHFASMLAGCESINTGENLSPDGRYAFSVLKLHAQDEGLVHGTEGLLDSIKKGASNVKEWIKKLINAILDFVFKGRKQLKEKQTEVKESDGPDSTANVRAHTKELNDIAAKRKASEKEKEKIFANLGTEYTSVLERLLAETKECNEKAKEGFAELNISNPPLMTKTITLLERTIKVSRAGDINPVLDVLGKAAMASFDELDDLTTTLKKLVNQAERIESPKVLSEIANKFTSVSDRIGGLAHKIIERKFKLHDEAAAGTL